MGFTSDTTMTQLKFINFKFLNEFKLIEKVELFAGFGLSLDKLLLINEKGIMYFGTSGAFGNNISSIPYNGKTTNNNFFDISIIFNLSYYLKINERLKIQFETLYKNSLNRMDNASKNKDLDLKFNDLRFNIGIITKI